MSIQKLGRRMYNDVHTKFQRSLQIWRHESVVADDARSRGMRGLGYRLQIRHDHYRIRRGFHEYHFCIVANFRLDIRNFRGVNERKLNTIVREDLVE